MVKIRFRIVGAIALAMLLPLALSPVFGGAPQGKGKPSPNPKASLTILDGLDIYGDGNGPYVDGQIGVEAQIWAGGSEDFTLRLFNSPRKFNVSHTFVGCGGTPCTLVADGTCTSGWWINICQIGNMAVGETKWTRAHVNVSPSNKSSASFSWCGPLDFIPSDGVTLLQTTNTCTGSNYLVSVFRLSSTDWLVSTSDPRDTSATFVAPVSGLIQSQRTVVWNGLYQTRFQLQIHLLP